MLLFCISLNWLTSFRVLLILASGLLLHRGLPLPESLILYSRASGITVRVVFMSSLVSVILVLGIVHRFWRDSVSEPAESCTFLGGYLESDHNLHLSLQVVGHCVVQFHCSLLPGLAHYFRTTHCCCHCTVSQFYLDITALSYPMSNKIRSSSLLWWQHIETNTVKTLNYE